MKESAMPPDVRDALQLAERAVRSGGDLLRLRNTDGSRALIEVLVEKIMREGSPSFKVDVTCDYTNNPPDEPGRIDVRISVGTTIFLVSNVEDTLPPASRRVEMDEVLA